MPGRFLFLLQARRDDVRDELRDDTKIQKGRTELAVRDAKELAPTSVDCKGSGDEAVGIDGDVLADPHADCNLTM